MPRCAKPRRKCAPPPSERPSRRPGGAAAAARQAATGKARALRAQASIGIGAGYAAAISRPARRAQFSQARLSV